MKSIDIKSVIIGMLGTILVFVSIGATDKNLGDITVNSITVVDENGEYRNLLYKDGLVLSRPETGAQVIIGCSKIGGAIVFNNADGKETHAMLTDDEGRGGFYTYNSGGQKTSFLGTGVTDGGILHTFSSDNKMTSFLGGGNLQIFNKHGVRVGYFGSNKSEDGVIVLSDRYGDKGWAGSGKK